MAVQACSRRQSWIPACCSNTSFRRAAPTWVSSLPFLRSFFKRTRAGFFIQATGENAAYAESIGVKTKQSVIAAVVMSGAVAGLAGVIEVLGVHGRFVNAFAGNIPLYGMLAALISNGSFLSMTIYSTLIGVLQAGSLGMERFTGLSEELINILISMFILFVMMDMKLGKGKKKQKPGKDKTEGGEKA